MRTMVVMRATLLAAAGGMLLLSLAGCSSPGASLSRQGWVTVQPVPSEKAAILWADVYRTGENLIVRGVARSGHASGPSMKMHVDAVVTSMDGKVLGEARSRDVWVPRRSSRRGIDHADFEIVLPPVGKGDIVRLVCHAGSRDVHVADARHMD